MSGHQSLEHGHQPIEQGRPRLIARLRRLRTKRLLPKATRRHLRNVAREQLLAVRSLLDAGIARLEPPEGKRS